MIIIRYRETCETQEPSPLESAGPEVSEKTGFEASAGMTILDFCNWLYGFEIVLEGSLHIKVLRG
jgi:hypothetical protein